MNNIHRVVWNESLQVWQAVAELAPARGKRGGAARRRRLAATLALGSLLVSAPVLAQKAAAALLPTGAQVTAGQAQISQQGSVLTVQQASNKLVTDWRSFDIGAGQTVNFQQPSATAVALNRVLGSDVSVIQGALNANGQVFLINPNGVLFTPTAQVNVGGLVASTLALSNEDFLAGRYNFSGSSSAALVNQGQLQATNGGAIGLIAARIVNTGSITAPAGQVLLGAGSQVTLDLGGPVKLRVSQGALDALISQGGAIRADGGLVYLTAKAAGELNSQVISHTGITEARTLATGETGAIYLIGDMAHGRIDVGGTLDASAARGGNGGFIETSAATVSVRPDVRITTAATQGSTGNWLIDPYDIVVAASGGHVTGATLSTALNSTNVTLDTTNTTYGTGSNASGTTYATGTPTSGVGDITINDAITKTGGAGSGTTLTLKAHNDININQAITSTGGRLNVALVADQDLSGAGSVSFGSAGRVLTNGGNFYVGTVTGSYDQTIAATAQNLTMASGSYVDVGTGNLNIAVKGNISLPDNSAQSVTHALKSIYNDSYRYFNSGVQVYYSNLSYPYTQFIGLSSTSGSITTANTAANGTDIVTSVDTKLSAGTLGASAAPLRISGPADPYGLAADPTYTSKTFNTVGRTLYLSNSAGNSYVSETGVQIFKTVDVTVGNQANATQNVQIMGDQGGTGHILLNTDGSGVLALSTGDVKTGGVPGIAGSYSSTPQGSDPSVFPTSLSINASNITFGTGSVDLGSSVSYYYQGSGSYYRQNWGMAGYAATFSAAGSTLQSSAVDGVADIRAVNVSLVGPSLGTAAAPLELGAGSSLTLYNTGGNSFAKVVDNTFSNVAISSVRAVGEHHVLWSGGDHIDFTTDTTGTHYPTISGGASDGSSFSATTGVDLSRGGRSMSFTATNGAMEFDTNSVNLAGGTFSAAISNGNSYRVGGNSLYATNAFDGAAEITAGDVRIDVYNLNQLAAGIAGLEFAKGGSRSDNSLSLSSYAGDISLRELTANHFKTVNVTLNGAHLAQTVAVDLAGADDINFADSGSLITLDATKLNLSSNNRNWNLQTSSRKIEVDGVALGSGSYTLYGGLGVALNADVLTNGGAISLTAGGTGLTLMRSLRIDSNADDLANSSSTGSAGNIFLNGNLSATAAGVNLVVDSGSSNQSGNTLQIYSGATNTGGHYLGNLTLTTKGSTNTNDGGLYIYGSSYLINGNFSATGSTMVQTGALTIDTEQGNVNDAGSISFAGYTFSPYYWGSTTLNTATTASGKVGGNVDLYGTYSHNTISTSSISINTSGGPYGQNGSITLPAVSTTQTTSSGTQTYTGGVIALHGNLSTNQSAISLNGDVQVAADLTIDTWSATNNVATGSAGSVTLSGGLSGNAANRTLTIDTSTATGSGYANSPTNTLSWTHNGGAVNLSGADYNGQTLGALVVTTAPGGSYNNGAAANITLAGVDTTGTQTYTGASTSFAGNVNASGLTLNTLGSGSTVSGSGVITANTLALNGAGSTAYNLATGTGHQVGTLAVDGASSLAFLNNNTALTIGVAGALQGITASGTVNVATRAADITVARNVSTGNTSSSAIVINAGQDAAAGTASGGNLSISGSPTLTTGAGGRYTLYTGSVADSGGLETLLGSGSGRFRYNSDETASGFSAALATGGYALYREQPTVSITVANASKTYDGLAYAGGGAISTSGLANGDLAAMLTGTTSYAGSAIGAVNAGSYTLTASGLVDSLGYALSYPSSSFTIDKAALTVTATNASKTYDSLAYSGGNGSSYSGFAAGDTAANSLGGSLVYGGSAQGAVNAGSYTIVPSGLSAANYTLSYANGSLTVNKAPLTVTADGKTKVYGNADPTLTYQVSGGSLIGSDSLSGSLTRAAGANVGSYTIDASALANGNYDITAVNGALSITPRPITVTADGKTKVYGNADPTLTYQVSSGNLVGADSLSGSLTRAAGSNVGSYTIDASALANGNYSITAVNGALSITPRPITVTADGKTKVYGNADPALSYQISSGNLVGADSLSGALSRVAGEDVGSHLINASALANGNYQISVVNGQLTITPAVNVNTIAGNAPTITATISTSPAMLVSSASNSTGLVLAETSTPVSRETAAAVINTGSSVGLGGPARLLVFDGGIRLPSSPQSTPLSVAPNAVPNVSPEANRQP